MQQANERQYRFMQVRILHPKVLKSILADAELTVEEFIQLLKGP